MNKMKHNIVYTLTQLLNGLIIKMKSCLYLLIKVVFIIYHNHCIPFIKRTEFFIYKQACEVFECKEHHTL